MPRSSGLLEDRPPTGARANQAQGMTPLVCPSYEYQSRPPYIVSYEWPAMFQSAGCPTIYHAFALFWKADFTSRDSPVGRLMVDSRGTHVLGYRADCDGIDAWVMTDEMRLTLERLCPQHAETIFSIEMSTRALIVLREEMNRSCQGSPMGSATSHRGRWR